MAVGMERYFLDSWGPLGGYVIRPNGFKVYEIADGLKASQWVGGVEGKWAVYLLEREGRDHFSTVRELASALRSKPWYMGIKDSNAHTEQLILVPNSQGLPPKVEGRGYIATMIGRTDRKPSHWGNEFNITLQVGDSEELKRRVEMLANDPFLPAFIGYQRFGTRRPVTHVIGKMISLRDWCGAFRYLTAIPYLAESEEARAFRTALTKHELDTAQKLIPPGFGQERVLVKRYMETGNCLEALKASLVPPSFFVEAYQSYLFNRYLSLSLDRVKKDSVIKLPTNFSDCDDLCKQIYLEEGIEKSSFRVKELKISLRPIVRKAFMEVHSLKVNGSTIAFSLERGMYASVLLREILRGDPRSFT